MADTNFPFVYELAVDGVWITDIEGYACLDYHHGDWRLGAIVLHGSVANASPNPGERLRIPTDVELKVGAGNLLLDGLQTAIRLWLLKEMRKEMEATWAEHKDEMKRGEAA